MVSIFLGRETDILDEAPSGRPHEATDPYHIEKVKEVLDEDRRLTCDEVAESVRISHGSAHEIITRHFKVRRIAARWLPHILTRDQLQERVRLAEEHINQHEKEGETFLNRIVAIDETWLRSYELELKSQSTEWHSPASPGPAKFRRKRNLKQLAIFAYDNSGLLTTDYVPVGETVNGEYYSDFLRKKMRLAMRKKRPALLNARPILLHNNAMPHKSWHVTSVIDEYKWETLKHPAYSPNLSSRDFDLFPELKKPLRGIGFEDLDELKVAVAREV